MFQFVLEIDHRRWGGWNKFEKECQMQVQDEVGTALCQCFFEKASIAVLVFRLSFGDRNTNVAIEPITRFEGRLALQARMEVDWRDKIDSDQKQMKTFIAQACILMLKNIADKLAIDNSENSTFSHALQELADSSGIAYDQILEFE